MLVRSGRFSGSSYIKILRDIYHLLEKSYPNEYVYKNKLINQWIMRYLGNENSMVFNEFRMGRVIADLAMFNGVSRVFEVKTPLDKETRLVNQLSEYEKLFDEVYVVVPIELLDRYSKFNDNVGVIVFDDSLGDFSLYRGASFNRRKDVGVIMEVLHTHEYIRVVNDYYGELPCMNAFNQFNICKELIGEIPNDILNSIFIRVMKDRSVHNYFFNKINSEFNQICLSMNLGLNERNEMVRNLKLNKF